MTNRERAIQRSPAKQFFKVGDLVQSVSGGDLIGWVDAISGEYVDVTFFGHMDGVELRRSGCSHQQNMWYLHIHKIKFEVAD